MINQHVVSLELSKQLYEAGIVVESEFYWEVTVPSDSPNGHVVTKEDKYLSSGDKYLIWYPAPLASELGELLPTGYAVFKCDPGWAEAQVKDAWCCQSGDEEIDIYGETETDARGKCLLYLKENNLLTETNRS